MATSTSPGAETQLKKANKRIANLLEDIRRLSNELKNKDALLTQFIDVAHKQSLRISTFSAALQDTVLWDPSGPRPSSCSTPRLQRSWVEVVTHGRKRTSPTAGPAPLRLSNRFEALSQLGEDPSVGRSSSPDLAPLAAAAPSVLPVSAVPAPAPGSNDPSSTGSTAPPPPPDNEAAAALHPAGLTSPLVPAGAPSRSTGAPDQQPSSRTTTSASRRRFLKDAVRRHSGSRFSGRVHDPLLEAEATPGTGSRHCPEPTGFPSLPPGLAAAALPQGPSPLTHTVKGVHVWAPSAISSHGRPRPLFPPSIAIIGDSYTRNIRFVNAVTHCLPGATVPVILDKLPGLLCSLPSSITRVLIHVGSNDTARHQSELTKKDFSSLFSILKTCKKAVFISGPLPARNHGSERFSRVLALNTWLQSACKIHNFGFIDNFNLFWNCPTLFSRDGVHPNSVGNQLLAANIQHAIQTSTRV